MTFEIEKALNKDVNRRDELIFGAYEPDKYSGGIRYFNCDVNLLRQLVEEKFADPSETQNNSPSIQDMLDTFSDIADDTNVEFGGYAVSPDRDDYRVTIESVDVFVPKENENELSMLVETLRYADEFSMDPTGDGFIIHAWWD